MDSSYWNYSCYRRCLRYFVMAVVKVTTPRPELPSVIKIKNKVFKVNK